MTRNKFIFLLVIAIGVYYAYSNGKSEKYNADSSVAILQLLEHSALNATREGIEIELERCCKIKVTHEIAQGNLILAAQIVQKFANKKFPIIVTLGTTVTQIAKKVAPKNTNIVFASVTDPVAANIIPKIKQNNAANSNITGVSNFIPVEPQLNFYLKLLPNLSKLGVIYNPGEINSTILLDQLKQAAAKKNIRIETAVANTTDEISTSTQNILDKGVDAIFINNDNTALAGLARIAQMATKQKIPVFCSDPETLALGVLASYGTDQFALGVQTAKIIEKILIQKKLAKNISFEFPTEHKSVINMEVAKKIGLVIPKEALQALTEQSQ